MIEIALDKNPDNTFKNKEYPVFEVQQFADNSFNTYLFTAQNIINHFISEPIIIIKILTDSCSLNFLALALFIKSYQIESCLECVVFKVSNYEQALKSYKPFVALTTGIRLALRLYKAPAKDIYRELENMGYLGIESHTDYLEHKIFLSLGNPEKASITFTANNLSKAISIASTLKCFALLNQNISATAEIKVMPQDTVCDINQIITDILNNSLPLISNERITFLP